MIRVEDLGFAWPGRPPLFSGLTLTLPEGCAIGVVGPNGTGKSTFLRLLTGLEKPAAGRIALAGLDLAVAGPIELARLIGAVLQSSDRHFLRTSVLEEVALGPRRLGLSDPVGRARSTLARLDLAAAEQAHPLDLDGGARRLVALACAIVHGPRLLLLDETQRGLDRVNRDRLARTIAAEVQRGATVLSVSHDADFTRRVATQVLRFSARGITLQDPGER